MEKSKEMKTFLDGWMNLTRSQTLKSCTSCGNPATEFSSALATKEYGISGLCQKCQDSVFGRRKK